VQHPAAQFTATKFCVAESPGTQVFELLALLLQFDAVRAASFGFEDGKDVPGLAESEKLFLFDRGKSVLLVPPSQVVHAGLVLIAEVAIQDVAGNLFGKLPVFVAQNTDKDRGFAFASSGRITHAIISEFGIIRRLC
jgi:hypothetical protein